MLGAALVDAVSANNVVFFSKLVLEGPYIFSCVSVLHRIKLRYMVLLAMQAANEGGFA